MSFICSLLEADTAALQPTSKQTWHWNDPHPPDLPSALPEIPEMVTRKVHIILQPVQKELDQSHRLLIKYPSARNNFSQYRTSLHQTH